MKLKNILIVVKDIERSRQFYHDLFGLELILDNDGNMILSEGLVLQDEKIWKEFLGRDIIRRIIPASYTLKNPTSRASWSAWKDCTLKCSM